MNKFFTISALFLVSLTLSAQNAYTFTVIKENPITSVKIKPVRAPAGVSQV